MDGSQTTRTLSQVADEARWLLAHQRAEEAEALARSGLLGWPGTTVLQMCVAEALLMQGRYRDGFREFESRVHRQIAPPRRLPYPEWDGPIAGRSILLWGEQGIGDEVQTVRFVRRLKALGAARITLACWPQSVRAFMDLGADRVISRHGDVAVDKHDCWAVTWSLPYRLGLDLGDIDGAPYLQAAGARGGAGIGLVERGRPGNPRDAERSMPAGFLQAAIPQGRLLQPRGDVLESLETLARLDLLITVDTSWAHMAGALGVPCWLLLPFRELDWRWMRERADSPWYASLRLFRQPRVGDWPAVIDAVRGALAGA